MLFPGLARVFPGWLGFFWETMAVLARVFPGWLGFFPVGSGFSRLFVGLVTFEGSGGNAALAKGKMRGRFEGSGGKAALAKKKV